MKKDVQSETRKLLVNSGLSHVEAEQMILDFLVQLQKNEAIIINYESMISKYIKQ